jgi:hypothetical protein
MSRMRGTIQILNLEPARRECVYLMRAGRHIKVGISKDVKGRQRDIQVGCPLKVELVSFVPGCRFLESYIHLRMDKWRAAGGSEWFADNKHTREIWENATADIRWNLAKGKHPHIERPSPRRVHWTRRSFPGEYEQHYGWF